MAEVDQRETAAPRSDPARWRTVARGLGNQATSVIALWALAVVQPVLDLFGQNPEFFVANDLTTPEVVVFALAVTLLGPLVLLGIEAVALLVDARVGRIVHHVVLAVLGAALALSLFGQATVEDAVIVVPVALFAGVVLAYLEATVQPVRSLLRYLALAPVLFLVAFLFFSPSAELLRGDPSAAIESGEVGAPAPIVLLSFDEFPVASIMRADGTINERRFPNFARLAAESSWFRNATSVAATTTESVPATFTGRYPEAGQLPTYRDHPRSLFTLLGPQYGQVVAEQVTEVCPAAICPRDDQGLDVERTWTALTDAAAVYGHLALPPSLAEGLPVIDRSWGNFVEQGDVAASGGLFVPSDAPTTQPGEDPGARYGDEATGLGPDPTCPDIELWCGPARVSEVIEEIDAAEGPTLYAVHATTPHLPWILSAEGRQYAPRSVYIEGIDATGAWASDPEVVRSGFQRHLLQIGAVDRLVGQLIDRLEGEGLWDEALVVVVADHGAAFSPGQQLRAPTPSTWSEIYHVPLFVKAPQQQTGEVRSDNALNVDVLPTIVDLLDIDTDWAFDGESLAGEPLERRTTPVFSSGQQSSLPDDPGALLAVARRNEAYLPHGDDWTAVAAVGPYGDLVGQPANAAEVSAAPGLTWTTEQAATLAAWDPDGDALAPLLVQGHLDQVAGAVPDEVLLVVNGTIAGVGVGLRPTGDGGADFHALLDESVLRPGGNAVALLVPVSPGSRQFWFLPLTA